MTETKPKRRWFRFSLRTLFVLMTVIGVWLGYQASSVRQRKQLLSRLDSVVHGLPTYKTVNRNGQQFVLNGDFATPADLQLSWIGDYSAINSFLAFVYRKACRPMRSVNSKVLFPNRSFLRF